MAGSPIVTGYARWPLTSGWTVESAAAGPVPAPVPGTVAEALLAAGEVVASRDLDADDWWYRCSFPAPEGGSAAETVLRFDGLATLADVWLNGERILSSTNMFRSHEVQVDSLLRPSNELAICFRALVPELERKRARARWRTRLVDRPGLRAIRTTLLGRIPVFAPGPALVGPWQRVVLEQRHRVTVERAELRTAVEGDTGRVQAVLALRSLGGETIERVTLHLVGPSGQHSQLLDISEDEDVTAASGELAVPGAARWWPHTHGEPVLHDLRVEVQTAGTLGTTPVALDWGRVGFRSLEVTHDPGLELQLNGTRVFCRGGSLLPDLLTLQLGGDRLRAQLVLARDAGMNMIRLSGATIYASDELLRTCDELGILVWQDFAFANLDYGSDDEAFRASVEAEASEFLARANASACLCIVCGNSEVEQQVAMLGLDPELGRGELFEKTLPSLVVESGVDAAYVPSTPSGGALPFAPNAGVAHYFGVGAYRRPLDDARRAEVRFAAECLAFANIPGAETLGELAATDAEPWAVGVPRDNGAARDFADVRDHYLADLFRVDPEALRSSDPRRYLSLSQVVTGEVMAAVFGEWRRRRSTCAGGLVWWLNDILPGSGWGVIDSAGRPKPAYWYLKRALAPLAVWLTDEGTNGVSVHVANDRAQPLAAELRVALYREDGLTIADASAGLAVDAHSTIELAAESVLGRFADVGYAFRFGPPEHDLVVATLIVGGAIVSESFHFPLGRPADRRPATELGLAAAVTTTGGGYRLDLSTELLAYAVQIDVPGFQASDNMLGLAPRTQRSIVLTPIDTAGPSAGSVSALNGDGDITVDLVGAMR